MEDLFLCVFVACVFSVCVCIVQSPVTVKTISSRRILQTVSPRGKRINFITKYKKVLALPDKLKIWCPYPLPNLEDCLGVFCTRALTLSLIVYVCVCLYLFILTFNKTKLSSETFPFLLSYSLNPHSCNPPWPYQTHHKDWQGSHRHKMHGYCV